VEPAENNGDKFQGKSDYTMADGCITLVTSNEASREAYPAKHPTFKTKLHEPITIEKEFSTLTEECETMLQECITLMDDNGRIIGGGETLSVEGDVMADERDTKFVGSRTFPNDRETIWKTSEFN
jgi:hypothetical protein